ncbi:MAG: hypothetical protein RLZZ453_84 [Chlamydiota bacterium]|jgi:hypothetical protein
MATPITAHPQATVRKDDRPRVLSNDFLDLIQRHSDAFLKVLKDFADSNENPSFKQCVKESLTPIEKNASFFFSSLKDNCLAAKIFAALLHDPKAFNAFCEEMGNEDDRAALEKEITKNRKTLKNSSNREQQELYKLLALPKSIEERFSETTGRLLTGVISSVVFSQLFKCMPWSDTYLPLAALSALESSRYSLIEKVIPEELKEDALIDRIGIVGRAASIFGAVFVAKSAIGMLPGNGETLASMLLPIWAGAYYTAFSHKHKIGITTIKEDALKLLNKFPEGKSLISCIRGTQEALSKFPFYKSAPWLYESIMPAALLKTLGCSVTTAGIVGSLPSALKGNFWGCAAAGAGILHSLGLLIPMVKTVAGQTMSQGGSFVWDWIFNAGSLRDSLIALSLAAWGASIVSTPVLSFVSSINKQMKGVWKILPNQKIKNAAVWTKKSLSDIFHKIQAKQNPPPQNLFKVTPLNSFIDKLKNSTSSPAKIGALLFAKLTQPVVAVIAASESMASKIAGSSESRQRALSNFFNENAISPKVATETASTLSYIEAVLNWGGKFPVVSVFTGSMRMFGAIGIALLTSVVGIAMAALGRNATTRKAGQALVGEAFVQGSSNAARGWVEATHYPLSLVATLPWDLSGRRISYLGETTPAGIHMPALLGKCV